MPLDPRISLLGQTPEFNLSPLFAAQTHALQQRGGLMALQEQERQLGQAEQVRQAYAQHYGQPGGVPPGLAGVQPAAEAPVQERLLGGQPTAAFPYGPTPTPPTPQSGLAAQGASMGMQTPNNDAFIRRLYTISPVAGREAEQYAWSQQAAQFDHHLKRVEYLAQVSQGILAGDSQQAYEVGKAMLAQAGMPTSEMPAIYDRSLVEQWYAMGQTSADQLNRAKAAHENAQMARMRSQAPDYGYGDELDSALYSRFGHQIPPGGTPTPAMVQQARQDVQQGKIDVSAATGSSQIVQTPGGYVRVNPRTGAIDPVEGPGGTALQPRPTEAEHRAQSLGERASRAHATATDLEGKNIWPGYWEKLAQKLPGGNLVLSAEQQQYQQALLEFTQALLRKESGAAVTASEYDMVSKTYFPQPGDKPEVLKQKQQARQEVIENLRQEAGAARPASPQGQGDGTPAPPQASQKPRISTEQIGRLSVQSGVPVEQVIERLRQKGYRIEGLD